MLRFGAFEVDPDAGELRKDGRRVTLQDKPFQLLLALLEQPGQVVTREALQQRLWPDVFVDFDGNLNASARKLRDALADSATEPRYIETVPRRGYRFIAQLESRQPEALSRLHLPWIAAIAVAVILSLAVVVSGWLRPAPRSTADRIMLAVLPFENLSGDTRQDANALQDYVSDGFTEELLTALGRLQPNRLGVIARITAMTYKGTTQPIREIGRELGVDYVLEGSVRGTTDMSRITAQLIAVDDETHLWAETYDSAGGDLLTIQADIARRIANSLALELLPDDPVVAARTATRVAPAYDHYLRGRFQWNRFSAEGNRYAIAELERAIELDPNYAQAHAALADAYNLQAFDDGITPLESFARARAAAERALELNPELAAAHNSLAFTTLYGDYDAVTADPLFRRALALAPNNAMAHHWHAGALAALGRHDEAIAAVRRALELDPMSSSVKSDLGWYFLFAGRWDEAIQECSATIDLHPGHSWATTCLIEGLIHAGDEAAAIHLALEQQRSRGQGFDGKPTPADLPSLLRLFLEQELAEDETDADMLYRSILNARLGDLGTAVDWLEIAFDQHEAWLVFLHVDPRLAALRGHPRFNDLASRLRLGNSHPLRSNPLGLEETRQDLTS